ncbi:MAG TPA: hypothetical protein VLF91_05345 [Candidatus Saccharimonadales bacterium]|nr:hypothetical protein [Candidatus Saccharimonadales bacterium]
MLKTILSRTATAGFAAATALCIGFVSQVSAATISVTGPDSVNKIISSARTNCTVTTTNNVNTTNNTNQSANSGNVTVSHNTTVGSGWASWDPAIWQAQGHSYAEWHTAFMAYMASQEGSWSSNWGSMGNMGGGASSGGASSGGASNSSNNNTSVHISNGAPACTGMVMPGAGGGTITETGPGSVNKILGESTTNTHVTFMNSVLGANTSNQSANSGNVSASHNTAAGGASSGNAGNEASNGSSTSISNPPTISGGAGGGLPTLHDPVSTISLTGPGSTNIISNNFRSNTNVVTTNTVTTTNTTNQTPSSGNVTVSGNTIAGSAMSGNAGNEVSNTTDTNIR